MDLIHQNDFFLTFNGTVVDGFDKIAHLFAVSNLFLYLSISLNFFVFLAFNSNFRLMIKNDINYLLKYLMCKKKYVT